jgi:hypothetical protein
MWQETEEGTFRVSTVQQQAPNLSGAYSVCSQAFVPRAGGDEYFGSYVYQPVRRLRAMRGSLSSVQHHFFFSSYLFSASIPTLAMLSSCLNFGVSSKNSLWHFLA